MRCVATCPPTPVRGVTLARLTLVSCCSFDAEAGAGSDEDDLEREDHVGAMRGPPRRRFGAHDDEDSEHHLSSSFVPPHQLVSRDCFSLGVRVRHAAASRAVAPPLAELTRRAPACSAERVPTHESADVTRAGVALRVYVLYCMRGFCRLARFTFRRGCSVAFVGWLGS